jgi:DNA gyrase/topoisomerase IV subunit B
MNKEKFSMKIIVRYIRDLSIVVAGIAVTLYASYQVTGKSEKRDMKLYLNSIIMEMEENIKVLDEAMEYIQPSLRYSEYLQTHDKESLNEDTIISYATAFFTSQSFTFKTNAFEMFKGSGSMRLMNDKELLLSIWDVYVELADLKQFFDWYHKIKTDDLIKEAASMIVVENKTLILKKSTVPLYNFYLIGLPQNVPTECERVLIKSKDLVGRL